MKIICTLDCEDVPDINDDRIIAAVMDAIDFGVVLVPTDDPEDPDAFGVDSLTVEVQR